MLLEAIVKIIVLGKNEYFKSIKNCFDFTVTAFAASATTYVYFPNDYSDARIIRFIVMARMVRARVGWMWVVP